MPKTEGEDVSVEEALQTIREVVEDGSSSETIEEEDILELTEIVKENESVESISQKIETAKISTEEKTSLDISDTVRELDRSIEESLISQQNQSITSSSIKSLLDAAKPKANSMQFRSGETLENIVMEALRPELSLWLNENLPGLVKQIVEQEIKKLLPEEIK